MNEINIINDINISLHNILKNTHDYKLLKELLIDYYKKDIFIKYKEIYLSSIAIIIQKFNRNDLILLLIEIKLEEIIKNNLELKFYFQHIIYDYNNYSNIEIHNFSSNNAFYIEINNKYEIVIRLRIGNLVLFQPEFYFQKLLDYNPTKIIKNTNLLIIIDELMSELLKMKLFMLIQFN